jgi:hypothetical protein
MFVVVVVIVDDDAGRQHLGLVQPTVPVAWISGGGQGQGHGLSSSALLLPSFKHRQRRSQ